jgi:hypothetical protein
MNFIALKVQIGDHAKHLGIVIRCHHSVIIRLTFASLLPL